MKQQQTTVMCQTSYVLHGNDLNTALPQIKVIDQLTLLGECVIVHNLRRQKNIIKNGWTLVASIFVENSLQSTLGHLSL